MEQTVTGTGLSVISYLYDKITNNQELTSVLGDRIFPLVAEEGTEYPYLIMKLESILPAYSKDGRVYDNITVSTSVYAKDYKTVAEIQESVRSLLESNSFKLETFSEDFNSDAYRQTVHYRTYYKN